MWLILLALGQAMVLALWYSAVVAGFGVRADPVTKTAAQAAALVLTVGLMGSPVTVALWLLQPWVVVGAGLLAGSAAGVTVAGQWLHVARVALLNPARVRAVTGPVRVVVEQIRRDELEQASSWFELDNPWRVRRRVQDAADRAVRAIEGGDES
jgi:hypothetical protein